MPGLLAIFVPKLPIGLLSKIIGIVQQIRHLWGVDDSVTCTQLGALCFERSDHFNWWKWRSTSSSQSRWLNGSPIPGYQRCLDSSQLMGFVLLRRQCYDLLYQGFPLRSIRVRKRKIHPSRHTNWPYKSSLFSHYQVRIIKSQASPMYSHPITWISLGYCSNLRSWRRNGRAKS